MIKLEWNSGVYWPHGTEYTGLFCWFCTLGWRRRMSPMDLSLSIADLSLVPRHPEHLESKLLGGGKSTSFLSSCLMSEPRRQDEVCPPSPAEGPPWVGTCSCLPELTLALWTPGTLIDLWHQLFATSRPLCHSKNFWRASGRLMFTAGCPMCPSHCFQALPSRFGRLGNT